MLYQQKGFGAAIATPTPSHAHDTYTVFWIENIVGKGENAGNQHFLLFSQLFSIKNTMSFFQKVENIVGKVFSPFLTIVFKAFFPSLLMWKKANFHLH